MKTPSLLTVALAAGLCACLGSFAQSEPAADRDAPGRERPQHPPPGSPFAGDFHAQRHGPDGPPGGTERASVEQWMMELKERNPEEFEKMRRMREEDPEAFRQALHDKVRKVRAAFIAGRYPQLHAAIMALPPEERDWILGRLQQHGPHAELRETGRRPSPEMEGLEKNAGELARAYRQAENPQDKRRIRAELSGVLEKLFDQREAMRARELENMERKIDALKADIEKRKSHRAEIIEARVKNLTEGESP
jgi:hypothetical protein